MNNLFDAEKPEEWMPKILPLPKDWHVECGRFFIERANTNKSPIPTTGKFGLSQKHPSHP
jgi:hypothetical protein